MTRTIRTAAALALALTCGCYHFSFEQHGVRTVTSSAEPGAPPPELRVVTYEEEVPTYLDGFVGTGTIDTSRYCREPVRTELRVTLRDVMIAMGTFFVYTPHTLSVTCETVAPRHATR